MVALKWLLMIVGAGLFGSAGALVAYDVYLSEQLRRLLSRNKTDESGAEVGTLARRPFRPVRWRLALQLTTAGALLLLITESFAVVPDGAAGVRVSEFWGDRKSTRLNSSHVKISYAVFCLKKKKVTTAPTEAAASEYLT